MIQGLTPCSDSPHGTHLWRIVNIKLLHLCILRIVLVVLGPTQARQVLQHQTVPPAHLWLISVWSLISLWTHWIFQSGSFLTIIQDLCSPGTLVWCLCLVDRLTSYSTFSYAGLTFAVSSLPWAALSDGEKPCRGLDPHHPRTPAWKNYSSGTGVSFDYVYDLQPSLRDEYPNGFLIPVAEKSRAQLILLQFADAM